MWAEACLYHSWLHVLRVLVWIQVFTIFTYSILTWCEKLLENVAKEWVWHRLLDRRLIKAFILHLLFLKDLVDAEQALSWAITVERRATCKVLDLWIGLCWIMLLKVDVAWCAHQLIEIRLTTFDHLTRRQCAIWDSLGHSCGNFDYGWQLLVSPITGRFSFLLVLLLRAMMTFPS